MDNSWIMGHYIDVRVSGSIDGIEIKPETLDIQHLARVLQSASDLIGDRNGIKEAVSLEIMEGSAIARLSNIPNRIFIAAMGVICMASSGYSLDGIEKKKADALISLQKISRNLGVNIDLYSDDPEYRDRRLRITPDTNFMYSEDVWVDTQIYLYGTIISAGGKSPNIHLEDDNGNTYIISIPRSRLASVQENMLYKYYEVEVRSKQNLSTWELDRKQIELVDIKRFSNKNYSEKELKEFAERATAHWRSLGLTGDEVLKELRGEE